MSALAPILAMGLGLFSLRLVGLLARDATLPPAWERALAMLPAALLSALVVSGLAGGGTPEPARLAAAAGAALVAYRTRRMWTCIAAGMALLWLLRAF